MEAVPQNVSWDVTSAPVNIYSVKVACEAINPTLAQPPHTVLAVSPSVSFY